jgi:hypothetical protein
MPRSRRLRTFAAVLALSSFSVLTAVAPPAGASPTGDFTYAVRPAQAGDTSRAQPHFSYALTGGSQVADSIEISNLGATPLTLDVYPADMVSLPGGGTAPAESDAPRRGVGAWITVSQTRLSLDADQTRTVPFHLQVPPKILPGDYVGAVVVAEDVSTAAGSVGVTTRVALQVNVEVPGALRPAAQLSDVHARRRGTQESITATLRNTGNVTLTVTGAVHLHHGSTNRELALTPTGTILFPGDSVVLGGRWDRLPTWGHYRVQVAVNTRTAEGSTIALMAPPATLTFFPWDAVLIVGIALILLLVLMVLRRRQEQRKMATTRPHASAIQTNGRGRRTSPPAHRRTNGGQPPAHRHRRSAA